MIRLSLTCMLIVLAAGCAETPVEHTVRKVPTTNASEPRLDHAAQAGEGNAKEPGALSDGLQNARADFEKTLKTKLEKLDAEIRDLQAKAATLGESAKAKWNDTMADLEAKQRAAREKLDELGKSTAGAWDHMRDGAKKAWEDLEQAVKKARSEF